jgi:carbon storage regulator CsrA
MLVLTRKLDQAVVINGNIVVTLRRINKHSVRLSFSAPEDVRIRRSELVPIDLDCDTEIEGDAL